MFGYLKSAAAKLAAMPRWRSSAPATRRRFVLRGAAVGLAVSPVVRLWMRTISQHHVFSVGGTMLIVLVFAGMGALAGLVSWWRRNPRHPRPLFVRAVGIVPFALLGPFTLLFLPSLLAAVTTGPLPPRRWLRRVAVLAGLLLFALTELILLTADVPGNAGVRLASGLLYLPLAYACFITIRLAVDPLPARARVSG